MYNVIIIGGGIAGLCTAIAFQKMGVNVKVYDKNSEPTTAGAGIIIAPNALKALEPYGISDQIKKFGNESSGFYLASEKGNTLSKLTIPNCYSKMYSIHREDLHQLLLSALHPHTIEWGKECMKIKPNNKSKVEIIFHDGTKVQGDLLIAADGIHSTIRKQLFQSNDYRFAGYTCWRGVTSTKNLSLASNFIETWGTKGRFGIVPLPNNQVYWYALLNSQAGDTQLKAYTTDDLYEHFQDYHNPIPNILQNTKEHEVIHRDIIDIIPMKQFFKGRTVFIGDAAHALTPNLGQGACQAIEDATILAECIQKSKNYGEAFIMYDKKRRARIEKISNQSWKVGKMSQVENKLLALLRNQVMKYTPQWLYERQAHDLYNFQV
ncbi:FAD-dependent oxidoreductase [Bacillus manliponensis]|uniref:FAD-dependent oxidoreductase n=1 Tax=Bacillus manliponensis TaxID=574376 RepID=UPI003512E8E0